MTHKKWHDVQVNVTGPGTNEILLDGVDITKGCADVKLSVAPGYEVTKVQLDLYLAESSTWHGDRAEVVLPEHTRRALLQLGWTPPTSHGDLSQGAWQPSPGLMAVAEQVQADMAALRERMATENRRQPGEPVKRWGLTLVSTGLVLVMLTLGVLFEGYGGAFAGCGYMILAGYCLAITLDAWRDGANRPRRQPLFRRRSRSSPADGLAADAEALAGDWQAVQRDWRTSARKVADEITDRRPST